MLIRNRPGKRERNGEGGNPDKSGHPLRDDREKRRK